MPRDSRFNVPPLGYVAWLTMVFTTYLFVFYFLPLVLVFYYALDGLLAGRRAPPMGGPAWCSTPFWFLQATSSTVGGIPGSSS